VTVTVSNTGPATATTVVPSAALTVNAVAAGNPSGPIPAVTCGAANPAAASIGPDSSQDFIYMCNNPTGNGFVTFTASASGHYVNTAADILANAAAAISNQLTVDTTNPTLTFGPAAPPPNGAGWNNTNVSFPYVDDTPKSPDDNLSGVASSVPASPVVVSTEGKNVTSSVTVTDNAGNSKNFPTPPVNIDKTNPTITSSQSPAPNANGWNKIPVTVTFTCVDSPPADNPAATPSGVESVDKPITLSNEGANQPATGNCTDVAGNLSSITAHVNIDFTNPTAMINVPPNAAVYVLNQLVNADYGCADALSGVFACAGTVPVGTPIATDKVGQGFGFSVTPTDKAGNVGTTAMTAYAVKYAFTGFQGPLTVATSTTAPPSDSGGFAAGIKLSIAWQLADFGGNFITSTSAITSLEALPNPACSGSPAGNAVPVVIVKAGTAAGTNTFTYDAQNNRYVAVWDTSTLLNNGCFNLVLTLDDGNSYATIVHIILVGFQAPLGTAGPASSPSDSGGFAASGVIPVQWQFEDGTGTVITNDQTSTINTISAFANPACSGPPPNNATLISLFEHTKAQGNNTLTFNTDGTYVFSWDTSALQSGGCFNLVLSTTDGSSYATIVHLTFAGFQPPLTVAGTTFLPSDSGNFTQANGNIAVTWQLEDSSGNIIMADESSLLKTIQVFTNPNCAGAVPAGAPTAVLYDSGLNGAQGTNTYSYDAAHNLQVLEWDPSSLAVPACYDVVLTLTDGSAYATLVHLQ
jgi:hypothetical protein